MLSLSEEKVATVDYNTSGRAALQRSLTFLLCFVVLRSLSALKQLVFPLRLFAAAAADTADEWNFHCYINAYTRVN